MEYESFIPNPTKGRLLPPKILEAGGGKLGVFGGVVDALVAEVDLDGAGILAVIAQLETAAVAQHMGMDRKGQGGRLAHTGQHLAESGGADWGVPFGQE